MGFLAQTRSFESFATASDAFFYLGKHSYCEDECCAPPLPPEMMCVEIAEPDPPIERCSFAVFDTETTGLSRNDVVLQFALALFDESGKMLQSYNRLWTLPENVQISRSAYNVHKIGYRRLREDGMAAAPQLRVVQKQLARLLERKVPIVAHNASFDVRLLKQTADKHEVEWDFAIEHTFCTMKNSKPYTNIFSIKTGKPKSPSNTELYEFLHSRKPEFGQLHDALTDVKVTAASYAAGRSRRWW